MIVSFRLSDFCRLPDDSKRSSQQFQYVCNKSTRAHSRRFPSCVYMCTYTRIRPSPLSGSRCQRSDVSDENAGMHSGSHARNVQVAFCLSFKVTIQMRFRKKRRIIQKPEAPEWEPPNLPIQNSCYCSSLESRCICIR